MKILESVVAMLLLLAAYLLFWPIELDPVAWTPPTPPSMSSGPYAANDRLRGVQRIADGIEGPEGIAVDVEGQVYAGLEDGRLLRFAPDFSSCLVLDHTGGRPLGLALAPDGSLLIADANNGLMSLGNGGQLRSLSREADGVALGFTDDLDVAPQSRQVYFSDASTKFGYGRHMEDLMEHGRHGRLLRYDLDSGTTTTLLRDRAFANGVAVGPDESYVLLNETWEYKVTRYWLKGDRAGQTDTFIDNLPGYPDNLSFNGRDRFWVALYAPRNALLDRYLPRPWLRAVMARLPAALRPKPEKQAHVVGLDLEGKVVASLQYAGADAYAPITSVEEYDGWLYLGSLSATALGRIRVDDALAGGQPPPEPLPVDCAATEAEAAE